jgi:hypothetical protein
VRQTVRAQIFYSLVKIFVLATFSPLGEGARTQLREIIGSNYGHRFCRSCRDVWKTLCNGEVVSDYSSGDNIFGFSYLLAMAFFFMPIAIEDGCITIYSASRRFKTAMLDRSKPLEHSRLHAYGHG